MARTFSLVLAASALLLAFGQASQAAQQVTPLAASQGTGSVSVIQAVPGIAVDVAIDGKSMSADAELGAIVGPFDLTGGTHTVRFTADSLEVTSTLDVAAGTSTDVVLHLPAEVDGDPVVHSYAAPTGSIGPDKARVVLAHTATVAPADVRVNGETVFTNIANGEFAEAELPSGTHRVALLPTGQKANPILGPLDVSLDSRTLSMIYAYGNPSDGSMNVIAHTIELAPDGTSEPTTIDTGSGGWAADLDVRPFSALLSEPTG
ncbi:MAG: DUF4397 domain-containing protein [Nocardioides sp.]|uniref:DUF4397 domain-containing protein n=1 Tax=Nocardioides sp. TaxID=35761 RepID=UPI003267EF7E